MEKYYISTEMYEKYNQLIESGQEAVKKIEEFKDFLKKNYIYEVELSGYHCQGFYASFIRYQRTEFSKKKYFGFLCKNISLGELCYAKIPCIIEDHLIQEEFDYGIWKKEELIEDLRIVIEDYNKDIDLLKFLLKNATIIDIPLTEPTAILSEKEKKLLKKLDVKEQEPIKPKGNPYSCESWKDRKHKFKGGKRK